MSDARCSVCGGLSTPVKLRRFLGTCGNKPCIQRAAERRRIAGMGRPKGK